MNKIERVTAVLEGRKPDRPPVSFWHHFEPGQVSGPRAVAAHIEHAARYDLDFLKVMNDNPYPRGALRVLQTREDLAKLKELSGEEPEFELQLEVIAGLKSRLAGTMLMTTTVFSPWTVLRKLTVPESDKHGPPQLALSEDERDKTLVRLVLEDRGAVKDALYVIAVSLGRFAARCLAAGADGIFLSVRDDWVDAPDRLGAGTYDEFVKSADVMVCEAAAAGSFNMLHVCGKALNFERFARYPCQVLNWADRYAGPSISAVRDWVKPAICGGSDNLGTLVRGTPEDCRREVEDALEQAGTRPIMISAGCTYDPVAVPARNLQAVCAAARGEG